ncbi:hypothetical protein PInf_016985 [Phytophthora infestans]|nr:hypothetical protein PInf_026831 [Phytophthora infestans]KAI9991594.1 hypothetical protein PInf_016884 [Phytophthora infestans]KAI9991639.1 hypothetical protein PInf_016985 [Phytophthora infestans]
MMLPALAQAMLVSDLALQLDLVVQVVVAPADLVVPLARLVVLQLGLLVQVVVKPAPADVADIFMRGKWDMIKRIILSIFFKEEYLIEDNSGFTNVRKP